VIFDGSFLWFQVSGFRCQGTADHRSGGLIDKEAGSSYSLLCDMKTAVALT